MGGGDGLLFALTSVVVSYGTPERSIVLVVSQWQFRRRDVFFCPLLVEANDEFVRMSLFAA